MAVTAKTAEGIVLNERHDGKIKIEMVYWGIDKPEDQRITVVVTERGGDSFFLIPKDDDVMNTYNHPFSTNYEKFATTPDLYEAYA